MKDRMVNRDGVDKEFTEYFYNGRNQVLLKSRKTGPVGRKSGINREEIIIFIIYISIIHHTIPKKKLPEH